jgi:hypothetical protein
MSDAGSSPVETGTAINQSGPISNEWGRIDSDGRVFVTENGSEREIGQWQAGTPEEGLAFYANRFDGLAFEVELLEKRLESGTVTPDDADKAIAKIRGDLDGAQAIGDLASLAARLQAIEPKLEDLRAARKAERDAKQAEAETAKTRIVGEAEKIAGGTDWRHGADRLRALLDEWKALPRLARAKDDELWHRFSTARTTYTKGRKNHFTIQSAARDEAAKIKEKLIAEAEALSTSTEWGPTGGAYRDLMTKWKAAGSAPRNVEDKLWKRFRAAQDAFFSAREAANAELDAEFSKNAEIKREILLEAEALLPVKDLESARKAWHGIADRWEAAGKVPREEMKDLENRIRTVERAIRDAEDHEWKRSDPEKAARADDMISKLEAAIAEIEADVAKAEAAGDAKKVAKLTENLQSRRAFLEMARKTAADF